MKKSGKKSDKDTNIPIKYTFIEQVPIKRVNELLKSDILDQLKYEDSEDRTAEDWKVNDFNILLEFFQHEGKIKRYYKPSKKDDTGDKRLYCGKGLQFLSKKLRAYLCQDDYIDIDIINCHPNILLQMMEKDGATCKYLKDYCTNRDAWIKKYDNKRKVLAQINDKDDAYNGKDDKETALYKEIYNYTKKYDKICNKLYQQENKLLEQIIKIATDKDIKINSLVFDGLIIKKSDHINDFIKAVNKKITPYTVIIKKWDTPEINITDTQKFDYNDPITFTDLTNKSGNIYPSISHFFIDTLPLFLKTVRILPNSIITKSSLSSLNDAYKAFKTDTRFQFRCSYKDEDSKKNSYKFVFIGELFTLFRKLAGYEEITPLRHPHPKQFSTDCGFLCSHTELPDDWAKRSERFKQHILDVYACGNEKIANGFYYWYANLIQTEKRSEFIMVTTGLQGIGKTIIPRFIINKILGNKGIEFGTLEEVLTRFNSSLKDKRLILVNELSNIDSKKKHADNDILKDMIDSPYFHLEPKNIDKYRVPNLIELNCCSNHKQCIKQADGIERRNFIINCDPKYSGNTAYFDSLGAYFDDELNIRSIFEFLNTYDISDKHLLDNLPITESKAEGLWRTYSGAFKACAVAFRKADPKEFKKDPDTKIKYVPITQRDIRNIAHTYNFIFNNDIFNNSRLSEQLKELKLKTVKPQNKVSYHLDASLFKNSKISDHIWNIVDELIKNHDEYEDDD